MKWLVHRYQDWVLMKVLLALNLDHFCLFFLLVDHFPHLGW